ncbi:MAG: dihydrofolate reductase family protein [Actinomycetota bacterium]
MTRKLISYLVHSIDGVAHDPQDWVFDRFDAEMLDHLGAIIQRQDTVLLGRNTYQAWAQYWPSADHQPFADFINGTHKYVVTNTLESASWENTTILDGDIPARVSELKEESGGEIGVHGSTTLVRSLLEATLLDELKLALFPVVTGLDDRPFQGLTQPQRMELLDVDRTGAGVLVLTYARAPAS